MLPAYGSGDGEKRYYHYDPHDLDQHHHAEGHHCQKQEPEAFHRQADGLPVDRIEAHYQEFLVEDIDQEHYGQGESGYQQHVVDGHSQNIAEKVAIKVSGIALREGEEHDSQGHSRGHENPDGGVLGYPCPPTHHSYADCGQYGRAHSEYQGIEAQEIAQTDASKGGMSYAVAYEDYLIQNDIDPDYAAEDGARQARGQGHPHKIVLEEVQLQLNHASSRPGGAFHGQSSPPDSRRPSLYLRSLAPLSHGNKASGLGRRFCPRIWIWQ